MSINSIIIFGIFSAILLIFSCMILQAPKLYTEFELNRSTYTHTHTVLKHSLVLRDRN